MVSLESNIKNTSSSSSSSSSSSTTKTTTTKTTKQPYILIIILASMAILLAFLYVSAVYMSQSYGPESKPISVRLESLTASNFNATSSPLLANWKVEIDIGNRRDNLRIDVERIVSLLYYKDHPISCASVSSTPFKVQGKKQRVVELFFQREACGGEQPFLDDGVLRELVEERRKGRISVTVEIDMVAAFDVVRSSWSWQRRLRPFCPTVDVEFQVGRGEGRLVGGDTPFPTTCEVVL